MLVVADQTSFGISGERSLAGTRQTEEDRDVAFSANVGRAVHAHHVALRQKVVHDRKCALLRFAGVRRATDEHEPLAEVHQDERGRASAVALWIGLETR